MSQKNTLVASKGDEMNVPIIDINFDFGSPPFCGYSPDMFIRVNTGPLIRVRVVIHTIVGSSYLFLNSKSEIKI